MKGDFYLEESMLQPWMLIEEGACFPARFLRII